MNSYLIDGIRTPIGNYKGTLSPVRTDDLGALVISEIAKRNPNIPKEAYDDVILGCANQSLRCNYRQPPRKNRKKRIRVLSGGNQKGKIIGGTF